MTLQRKQAHNGKLLAALVSGKLTRRDCARFVPEFERLIRQHGKLNLRFEMTDFSGLHAGALWVDSKIGIHHFDHIDEMAMFGESRRQPVWRCSAGHSPRR